MCLTSNVVHYTVEKKNKVVKIEGVEKIISRCVEGDEYDYNLDILKECKFYDLMHFKINLFYCLSSTTSDRFEN